MTLTKPAAIMRRETAANYVGLSIRTMEALIRKSLFPQPVVLADRAVGWRVRELEEWAESRPVSDLPPPPNTGKRKEVEA